MFKALTPIIGIVIAVGLFFTYVRPSFEDVKGIQDETAEYAQAVEKASELQQRISELKQRQSSISLANLERLEALLPDRVDEVAILLDVDALATLHHLTFGDIKVEEKESAETEPPDAPSELVTADMPSPEENLFGDETALGTDPNGVLRSQYSTLDISFSVAGAYSDFRLFLQDIERSLVLMEVTRIVFITSEGNDAAENNAPSFTVRVRLYSLNPPTS